MYDKTDGTLEFLILVASTPLTAATARVNCMGLFSGNIFVSRCTRKEFSVFMEHL